MMLALPNAGKLFCVVTVVSAISSTAIHAEAAAPLSLSAIYKGDIAGVADGGAETGARYLDNLQIIGDVDLDAAIGWHGATIHGQLLNNLGGKPNDLAGTLQGINNIEVTRHRAKLFEAWIQQNFAGDKVSLLIGQYDLNSEFYQNDAAALLIAPAFGIGSELASTGPNGPSIFPSTALTARLRFERDGFYAQAAVLNAKAGTLGDADGFPSLSKDGVLAVAESGLAGGGGKLSLGLWQYSKRQPDIIDTTQHRSRGAYLLAEYQLAGSADELPSYRAFFRLGASDGKTTPFDGGWQAGVLVERPFASRPDSSFSIGVNQAYLSGRYRRQGGTINVLPRAETGFEVTYSDKIERHITLQPDLQYIHNPAGGPGTADALVIGLRFQIEFATGSSGE